METAADPLTNDLELFDESIKGSSGHGGGGGSEGGMNGSDRGEMSVLEMADRSKAVSKERRMSSSLEEVGERNREAAGCLMQTRALIMKNLLGKIRTPMPTFVELFSPVLMMLVLVAAYSLSSVIHKDARIYSDWTLDIPGGWGYIATSVFTLLQSTGLTFDLSRLPLRDPQQQQQTPLPPNLRRLFTSILPMGEQNMPYMSLQQFDEHILFDAPANFNHSAPLDLSHIDLLALINNYTHFQKHRPQNQNARQLQFDDDFVGADVEDEPINNAIDFFDVARQELNSVLRSPIPIPTLRQFMFFSDVISSAVDPNQLNDFIRTADIIREWGNLLTLGTIHLTPKSHPITKDFINYLNHTYDIHLDQPNSKSRLKLRTHENEQEAVDFILKNLDERAWALIDFSASGTSSDDPNDVDFKIRMNYTTLPNTNQVVKYFSVGLHTEYHRYYLSGYLTLQRTIDEFAFYRKNMTTETEGGQCIPPTPDNFGPFSVPMPTASFSQNAFFQAVGFLLGVTMAMAFLYPVSRLIKNLVEEKESRMKETLSIFGVHSWAHWTSWVLTSLLFFFFMAVSVTYVISTYVFQYSSVVYLFLYIFFFGTSGISFSFFVASFFSHAKLASIVGPMALFATLLPRWIFFGTNRYEATAGKYWASILPCTAFAFGADIISDYEYANQGVQPYNAIEGEYSFNTTLGFLFFDTFLYMILAGYIEAVMPRQYGMAKKFYFPLLPSFWMGPFYGWLGFGKSNEAVVNYNDDEFHETSNGQSTSNYFERVLDPSLVPRVRISHLVKQYSNSRDKPPAVNDLTLTMYESQITCLLGHNGAGKTSTISVLTGLYPATSGDCIIYGNSISRDLMAARQSMGICPQHDVLFDNLTVLEHLRLFERIKGLRASNHSLKERAIEVGLGQYLHTKSAALSGGNKRKLSVAIALCGDPQFLILDEPTSGMDPYSRRATWELLRRKRIGRVTLLTTHFMDEAEILADRIAVLKEGRLQCSGTGLFLKERFGLGYNLTIVIDTDVLSSRRGGGDEPEQDEQIDNISAFIRQFVPSAELTRRSARELTYRFPQNAEHEFPNLFDELEKNRSNLNIGGYGVNNTTLEEVFLQLAEDSIGFKDHANSTLLTNGHKSSGKPPASDVEKALSPVVSEQEQEASADDFVSIVDSASDGDACSCDAFLSENDHTNSHDKSLRYVGWSSQVWILIQKRLTVQKRDVKGAVFMLVLPVLLIALVLLILTLPVPLAGPSIELGVDLFDVAVGGGRADTNVLFAERGGAPSASSSSGGTFVATEESKSHAATMARLLSEEYKHAVVDVIQNVTTSFEMSEFMLETYNDHNHDTRYGAFVFEDFINATVNFDWDKMVPLINATFGLFDLIEMEGTTAENGVNLLRLLENGISVNATVQQVADLMYSVPSLTPETEIRRAIALTLTSTLIRLNTVDPPAGKGPIVLINSYTNDGHIRLDDFLSVLSILSGGNEKDLNGYWSVEIPSANLHVDDMTITIPEIIVKTGTASTTISDVGPFSIQGLLLQVLPKGSNSFSSGFNTTLTILHNATSAHGVASFNQAYNEYMYKKCTGDPNARLQSLNHPLPLTVEQSVEVKAVLSVIASLFICIPYNYVPAAFIVFLVKERVSKSKHLQLVSGVDMSAYWVSTYLWDLLLHSVLTIFIMVAFLSYGRESAEVFVGTASSFICTLALTFGYGLSSLPFAYLLSRSFTNHSNAQISVMGGFVITGFVAVNAYLIMRSIDTTADLAENLRPLFRCWPAYNVGDGLVALSDSFLRRKVLGESSDPFDWDVCGKSLFLLYILWIPYFLLLLMFEYADDGGSGGTFGRLMRSLRDKKEQFQFWMHGVRKTRDGRLLLDDGLDSSADENMSTRNEDVDVSKERSYVVENRKGLELAAPVLLDEMWKVYPPTTSSFRSLFCCCRFLLNKVKGEDRKDSQRLPRRAVRGLSTAIKNGETFGLLGVNGAGKTTTLNVLTGDVAPTSGGVFVAGFDVTGRVPGGVSQARKNIGYCPQIDPLLDLMTGRETLLMLGNLRGIPKDQLDKTVEDLLKALTLSPHMDKPSETYSGGNKRKLSLGAALIGNPKVLFIDEASSGMDPAARRYMWDLITEASRSRSVVLTTHSMEEAEALCTRVAIMISGRMRCLGSVQHLKTNFLGGYTIDIRCRSGAPEDVLDDVVYHIRQVVLPGAALAERHGRFLRFDTTENSKSNDGEQQQNNSLGNTFRLLQEMKTDERFMVENYSVSQCSLEQVFINLASTDAEKVASRNETN